MGSSAGLTDPNRPGAEMRCARGNKGWVQQQGGAAALLADAYRRARGGYVAFLNESFELGANRRAFSLMLAVVGSPAALGAVG